MGEGFYFLDILIFAMIAAFLVYRLRNVLGRRHGEERQRPNPYNSNGQQADSAEDNVISLPERNQSMESAETAPGAPGSVSGGITQIKVADPSFDDRQFLRGAKMAFEAIVAAFAKGDTATLRPLLADDVYENFAEAIRQRSEAGETLETTLVRSPEADITDARMNGNYALVTVTFTTRQINIIRDSDGEILEGDPDHDVEVVDIWTFSRNVRSKDPNWLLVETSTPDEEDGDLGGDAGSSAQSSEDQSGAQGDEPRSHAEGGGEGDPDRREDEAGR